MSITKELRDEIIENVNKNIRDNKVIINSLKDGMWGKPSSEDVMNLIEREEETIILLKNILTSDLLK